MTAKRRVPEQGALNFWEKEDGTVTQTTGPSFSTSREGGSTSEERWGSPRSETSDAQRGDALERSDTTHSSARNEGHWFNNLTERQILVECIRRDEETIRNGWVGPEGEDEQFYESRIEGYLEELLALDARKE